MSPATAWQDTPQETLAEPKAPASSTENATKEMGLDPGVTQGQPLVQFSKDVYPILKTRCSECHGAENPKGALNIFDQEGVLGYVTPGSIEKSPLWTDYLMADPNEKDSQVMPPIAKERMPVAELAILRTWIVEGATWQDVSNEQNANVVANEVVPSKSFATRAWLFLGHLHPAVVHFPIALVIVAAAALFLSLFTGKRAEDFAIYCIVLGAISSLAAALFGWSLAETKGYAGWATGLSELKDTTCFWHRWLGLSTSLFCCTTAAIAVLARNRRGWSLAWKLGLFTAAALIAWVGHQGGEMVYGEAFFHDAIEMLFQK